VSGQLIARSPDLRRLAEEGYEVEVRGEGALLLVHHVPYVTEQREVKLGTIVSTLVLAGDKTAALDTHVVDFAGEWPCDEHGQRLTRVVNGDVNRRTLADGVQVDFVFSSKPNPTPEFPAGYRDYYDKITSYVNMLLGPAQVIDPSAQAQTFQGVCEEEGPSVFEYAENASIRAGIGAATARLKLDKVAIVGLGGTGAYILDLLAKLPIGEIHLFDGDAFLQHNAFRSPGAASIDELRQRLAKVVYLRDRYASMRRGIIAHEELVHASNVDQLAGMDFVFIAIDHGPSRKLIVEHLERIDGRFIDVGMGLGATGDERIEGQLRVTTSLPGHRAHVHDGRQVPFGDPDPDNLYTRNIQVADLNMLNAVLAVIKFKKIVGFYADLVGELATIYALDTNDLINEETTT
jgi:hypothetical protein